MKYRLVHLNLLFLLLLLTAGCGNKGPVRPLRQPLPAAPQALQVVQKGTRFIVAWNLPKTNQDGSELTDLEGFHVYKMKYDLAQDCPECRDTSVLLQDVDLGYLRDVRRSGDRLFLWDGELEADFGYQYRITPYNTKGREGEPTQLRVPFFTPPPSPETPVAEAHDRLVRLRWPPVPAGGPWAELLGYNLYRRQGDEPFPPQPLNGELLTAPTFEDYGVENGKTYIYAVRTVVRIGEQRVESGLSDTAEGKPQQGL